MTDWVFFSPFLSAQTLSTWDVTPLALASTEQTLPRVFVDLVFVGWFKLQAWARACLCLVPLNKMGQPVCWAALYLIHLCLSHHCSESPHPIPSRHLGQQPCSAAHPAWLVSSGSLTTDSEDPELKGILETSLARGPILGCRATGLASGFPAAGSLRQKGTYQHNMEMKVLRRSSGVWSRVPRWAPAWSLLGSSCMADRRTCGSGGC